jgi:hypothetical protein
LVELLAYVLFLLFVPWFPMDETYIVCCVVLWNVMCAVLLVVVSDRPDATSFECPVK